MAGILGRYNIHLSKDSYGPQGNILQVANWRGNYIENARLLPVLGMHEK